MPIFRLYAYAVNPQRTLDPSERVSPLGGAIDMDANLCQSLDAGLSAARRRMTRVALRVDTHPSSRTSEVRDSAMNVAFAPTSPTAEQSALSLAERLSGAMDRRSSPCLFLVAASRDSASAAKRQIALWVFPRGEGFRFQSGQQRLQLVRDYFDRNSTQRKLAFFNGHDARTQFLEADVLDLQAGSDRELTDLWVEGFLDAGPSITQEGGTRMLAKAFRELSKADLSNTDRQQVQAAVMALRQTPQTQWSVDTVGQQFLSSDLKDRFLEQSPNAASRQSTFTLDKELFGKVLNFRVFRLENDVFVSSPITEIGNGVTLSANGAEGSEHLSVEGIVVEDKLAQRRGV